MGSYRHPPGVNPGRLCERLHRSPLLLIGPGKRLQYKVTRAVRFQQSPHSPREAPGRRPSVEARRPFHGGILVNVDDIQRATLPRAFANAEVGVARA